VQKNFHQDKKKERKGEIHLLSVWETLEKKRTSLEKRDSNKKNDENVHFCIVPSLLR